MLKRDQSVLVIVDMQDKVMPGKEDGRGGLVKQTVKLIEAAAILGIPVLVTEQNPERLGETTKKVAKALGDTRRHAKMEFGCFGNEAFTAAISGLGRRQVVLAGVETHVCISQTAFGAIERGYQAIAVRDAIASINPAQHGPGIERLRAAGVDLPMTIAVLFEWLGKAGTDEFRAILPLLK